MQPCGCMVALAGFCVQCIPLTLHTTTRAKWRLDMFRPVCRPLLRALGQAPCVGREALNVITVAVAHLTGARRAVAVRPGRRCGAGALCWVWTLNPN